MSAKIFEPPMVGEDPELATQDSRQRVNLRLWKRRDISEEDQKGRALAIALKYGVNGEDALALTGEIRNYKGATVNLANSNWMGSHLSADAEQQNAMPIMRARARDLEENNPYAERYLTELEANVLGPEGMTLQSQVQEWDPTLEGEADPKNPGKNKMGGWVPDEVANDKIEDAWFAFKEMGVCDVTGELSYHEIERLMLRSTARDGHALCRIVGRGDGGPWKGNKFGIALQLIESDALDHTYNASLPNGNFVVMGVEMDQWRRRVAYHILTRHPGDFYTPATAQRRERVDARDVIHLRFLRRINQTVGVSWFSPVMDLLEMLRGYEEAELISARAEAGKGGFLYSDLVPEGGFAGAPPDPTKASVKKITPGFIERLPYGLKFQAHNPTHPNGNYSNYRAGVLRGIASGLSVSYNILANDLTAVNYGSLRGGLMDEREVYKMLQSWFISRFEMVVFQAWLESAILAGAVKLPFFKFDKFNCPYFQGRRWDWIDPSKDIDAIDKAIAIGLTSRRTEAAKRGVYINDVAREQKADNDLAKRYGLTWGTSPLASIPATPPEAPAADGSGDGTGDGGDPATTPDGTGAEGD